LPSSDHLSGHFHPRTAAEPKIKQIRDYIDHWNTDSKPSVWAATADEILAKVQLAQTSIKKLVDNNAK
jgi:hypothetical protein